MTINGAHYFDARHISGSVSLLLSFTIRVPRAPEEVEKVRAQVKLSGNRDAQLPPELISHMFIISVEVSGDETGDVPFMRGLSQAVGAIKPDAEYEAFRVAGRTGFYEMAQLFQRAVIREAGPRRVIVESAAFPNAPDIRSEFIPDVGTKVRYISIDREEPVIEPDAVRKEIGEKLKKEIEEGKGQRAAGVGKLLTPGDAGFR